MRILEKIYLSALVICMCVMASLAHAADSDVLCPSPEEFAKIAPADLAQVQNDIDRYTLCVKRAKLLSDLDALIKERVRGKEEDGMGGMLSNIQPMPAQNSTDELQKMLDLLTQKQLATVSLEAEPKSMSNDDSWYIKKMWGQSNQIRAQLAKQDGLITTVSEGDTLPDGWQVSRVSMSGVALSRNGQEKQLKWLKVETNENTVK